MLHRIRRIMSRAGESRPTPIVSIVVIVYNMPSQAKNTLISLSASYQQDVEMDDFEVIVVENESPNLIDENFVASLPRNVRYYMRKETEPTPVHAINFGASRARGDNICLMIDGARVLTPGVVKNIIMGHKLSDRAVVSVPGYHLGDKVQQESVVSGYGLDAERELMSSIDWPSEGYRLFDIGCFSASSEPGFFLPNSESNCISIPRNVWRELGGYDAQFNLKGGGLINLDFYKRACEHAGMKHVIIPGEGTFHQFHGGVTTGGEDPAVRTAYIEASENQYRELRGEVYSSPVTKPAYLGGFPEQAKKFLHFSSGVWLKSRGEKPLA